MLRARHPDDQALLDGCAEIDGILTELDASAEQRAERDKEQDAQQADLSGERWRWQQLFDLAPVAYIVTDRAGLIIEANRTAMSLLALPSPASHRMPLVLRFARTDRPAVQRMLRAPQRNGPGPIMVTLIDGADTDFRGALRCVSVRADRVLWVLDDVSAAEGARELQQRAMERERAASEQLRATDSMRRAFLLGVSHDLRVPLAAIAGFASVLHNASLGIKERQHALARLEETAHETMAMLDGLLDYERIDQPNAAVHRTRGADISAQVALAADAARMDGTDGHALRIETGPTSGDVDLVVVERIISNLVRNAVQHTPAGTTISVRCSREPDGVLLVVEDDGPGIAPERRESVFNLFERAHESSGIGAGLALVRRFARLHGGYARLEERPGGGASFQVLLDG